MHIAAYLSRLYSYVHRYQILFSFRLVCFTLVVVLSYCLHRLFTVHPTVENSLDKFKKGVWMRFCTNRQEDLFFIACVLCCGIRIEKRFILSCDCERRSPTSNIQSTPPRPCVRSHTTPKGQSKTTRVPFPSRLQAVKKSNANATE